jgi:hypothetical protein
MKLHGMIPEAAVRHEQRDTSSLIYREGTGEYHVRGAVCWPVLVSGAYQGCALVGGLDVAKNRVVILCEFVFATVETTMDSDRQSIINVGLASWLSSVWTTFYCYRYFVEAGANGQHDRYGLEVRASPNIRPAPSFKLIDQLANYQPVIQQYLNGRRLIYPKDGLVHQHVMQAMASGPDQASTHPVIRALGVLLSGYMAFPWRKADEPYGNVLY